MLPINRLQPAAPVDLDRLRQFLSTPYQVSPSIATVQDLLKWKFTIFNWQLYQCTSDITALRLYLMLVHHSQAGQTSWFLQNACESLEKKGIVSLGQYCNNIPLGIEHELKKKLKESPLQKAVAEVLTHGQEIGLTLKERMRFTLLVLNGSSDSDLIKLAFKELHQPELTYLIDADKLLEIILHLGLRIQDDSIFLHPFLQCHELPLGKESENYRDLLLQRLPDQNIQEMIDVLPLLNIPEENALALKNEPARRKELRKQARNTRRFLF